MPSSRPFSSASEPSTKPSRAAPQDERAQAEERYQLALESIDYAFYDWDIGAGIVHTSPALGLMLGLPSESLAVPGSWADWIHPDDRPVFMYGPRAADMYGISFELPSPPDRTLAEHD